MTALPTTADAADPTEVQPPKRRRVALACVMCRMRKSRCNGARPRCASCEYLGFECVYEGTVDATSQQGSSNSKAQSRLSIQQRLDAIEAYLSRDAHGGSLTAGPPTVSQQQNGDGNAVGAESPSIEGGPRDIRLKVASLRDAQRDEVGDVTDGMAISFVHDREAAYFGASSNIAFSRQVIHSAWWHSNSHAAEGASHQKPDSSLFDRLFEASRAPSPSSAISAQGMSLQSSLMLPPVAEMEQLITSYFANTALIFPFLHEATFWEAYQQFKSCGFSQIRRTWLGLLNVIMALACSTAPDRGTPSCRDAAARVFYDRAIRICAIPVLRFSNIEVVQSLLLLVQYLQGTQMSVQAWGLHGLAVKASLSLGLHCTQLQARLGPVELEMRKRTWHCCISLDRVLSMTFGRPPLIPQEYVRVASPQAWPRLSIDALNSHGEDLPSDSQVLSTIFFSKTVELYSILGNVIGKVYGFNLESTYRIHDVELVKQVMELDQSLELWQASLPDSLAMDVNSNHSSHNGDETALSGRLRTILTLRFLTIKILAHRSLLMARLDRMSVPKSQRIHLARPIEASIQESVLDCTQCAKLTINIVHTALTTNPNAQGLLGAWWFTLYYVFTASLTLYGSLALRDIESKDTVISADPGIDSEGQIYLSRATDTMRLLGEENVTVRNCAQYVEGLQLAGARLSEARTQQTSHIETQFLGRGPLGALDLGSIVDGFPYSSDSGPFFAPDLLDESFFRFPLPN